MPFLIVSRIWNWAVRGGREGESREGGRGGRGRKEGGERRRVGGRDGGKEGEMEGKGGGRERWREGGREGEGLVPIPKSSAEGGVSNCPPGPLLCTSQLLYGQPHNCMCIWNTMCKNDLVTLSSCPS